MSDTPETEAFSRIAEMSPEPKTWADFARKLERERDDARRELAELKETNDHLRRDLASEKYARETDVQAIERERDEARMLNVELVEMGDQLIYQWYRGGSLGGKVLLREDWNELKAKVEQPRPDRTNDFTPILNPE
jgi:hypothetical protein